MLSEGEGFRSLAVGLVSSSWPFDAEQTLIQSDRLFTEHRLQPLHVPQSGERLILQLRVQCRMLCLSQSNTQAAHVSALPEDLTALALSDVISLCCVERRGADSTRPVGSMGELVVTEQNLRRNVSQMLRLQFTGSSVSSSSSLGPEPAMINTRWCQRQSSCSGEPEASSVSELTALPSPGISQS
ncbi:unnamed protein product [Pleuronectes platessa]|uniref:Uncharacterized protein n=1 Tax=Pleuronectes platessa TaxID=8262 RepID=A0A9N7TXS8_PLEPL|nr:unnamed protein product [Pleuronectes platessa]